MRTVPCGATCRATRSWPSRFSSWLLNVSAGFQTTGIGMLGFDMTTGRKDFGGSGGVRLSVILNKQLYIGTDLWNRLVCTEWLV